jgi:hypothetical protein
MSTQYTFDADIVSDLHKDAHGFRPSQFFWAQWDRTNDDGRQKIWDGLLEDLRNSIQQEKAEQELAIQRFEQLVSRHIEAGAGDRATALRWIMDTLDWAPGDWDALCYEHGLPYGYFRQAA